MLRGIWVRLVLLVMTILLATPVTIVVLLVPGWSNFFVYAGRIWSRTLLTACGARLRVHGLEHASAHESCIFIANHLSIVDIWALFCVIPPNTRFVAKQELFRIPIFGWALAATGCISVNRANRAAAIRSLGVAAERIRAGRSVVMFPEGTRSRDGSLQPFKKGAFHLAVRAGVPVVPVAITGSFHVIAPRTLRVRPGTVEVWVEPPVDVTPYRPDDHQGLLRVVQETIAVRFGGDDDAPDRRVVAQEGS